MISMICKIALLAVLKYHGTEPDGTNNYLFSASRGAAKCLLGGEEVYFYGPLDLSYSAREPLQISAGEVTKVAATGDCFVAWGVDEKATAQTNTWHPFKKWLCTANELKITK